MEKEQLGKKTKPRNKKAQKLIFEGGYNQQ